MLLLTPILALLLPVAGATASPVATTAQGAPKAEVALTYDWVHTNAPPTDCGCFSMNGGSASFAYRLKPSFSVVAEGGAVTNGNVNSTGLGLTLAEFLAGARYTLPSHSRLHPFGQILVGGVHSLGSLSPENIGVGSSNAFAMSAGGGLDVSLSRRVALRVVQAEYFLTLLPNRTSDSQNNVRIGTGIVFHF